MSLTIPLLTKAANMWSSSKKGWSCWRRISLFKTSMEPGCRATEDVQSGSGCGCGGEGFVVLSLVLEGSLDEDEDAELAKEREPRKAAAAAKGRKSGLLVEPRRAALAVTLP